MGRLSVAPIFKIAPSGTLTMLYHWPPQGISTGRPHFAGANGSGGTVFDTLFSCIGKTKSKAWDGGTAPARNLAERMRGGNSSR
jgi:hypothetical protein